MTVFMPSGDQLLEQVNLSANPFGILRSAQPSESLGKRGYGGRIKDP